MIGRQWLSGENIKGRASHFPGIQSCYQIVLDDDFPTRTVDDANPGLHSSKRLGVEHPLSLFGDGHMDGYEIGLSIKIIKINKFDAQGLGAALGKERYLHDNLNAKGTSTLGNCTAE